MIDKEILGGVSPLKARQSSRGGKSAGTATQTARKGRGTYEGRGGFAKSTGKRGAGGRNVGGYNVNTRFKASEPWKKPASGGTSYYGTSPKAEKPTEHTPEGKPVAIDTATATANAEASASSSTSGKRWVPGTDDVYGTRKGDLPTYAQAWEKMEATEGGRKNKHGDTYETFDDFEKAAKDWNKEHGRGEGEDEKYLIEKGRKGYWEDDPDAKSSSSSSSTASASSGAKFTMKGNPMYRNFGVGAKPVKN